MTQVARRSLADDRKPAYKRHRAIAVRYRRRTQASHRRHKSDTLKFWNKFFTTREGLSS
jgi:hypothetical protein